MEARNAFFKKIFCMHCLHTNFVCIFVCRRLHTKLHTKKYRIFCMQKTSFIDFSAYKNAYKICMQFCMQASAYKNAYKFCMQAMHTKKFLEKSVSRFHSRVVGYFNGSLKSSAKRSFTRGIQ